MGTTPTFDMFEVPPLAGTTRHLVIAILLFFLSVTVVVALTCHLP